MEKITNEWLDEVNISEETMAIVRSFKLIGKPFDVLENIEYPLTEVLAEIIGKRYFKRLEGSNEIYGVVGARKELTAMVTYDRNGRQLSYSDNSDAKRSSSYLDDGTTTVVVANDNRTVRKFYGDKKIKTVTLINSSSSLVAPYIRIKNYSRDGSHILTTDNTGEVTENTKTTFDDSESWTTSRKSYGYDVMKRYTNSKLGNRGICKIEVRERKTSCILTFMKYIPSTMKLTYFKSSLEIRLTNVENLYELAESFMSTQDPSFIDDKVFDVKF